jgi:DNA-directed RNA polymerase specialized sigma24 family protein
MEVMSQAKWELTKSAFDKFLECLDPDRDRAGEKYEQLRSRLISYFEWRDCPFPEESADETINRIVRKISRGQEIRDPATYIYGVARMLMLEIAKGQRKERAAFEEMAPPDRAEPQMEVDESSVECLKRCLGELSPESRTLITRYYQGEKRGHVSRRLFLQAWRIPAVSERVSPA